MTRLRSISLFILTTLIVGCSNDPDPEESIETIFDEAVAVEVMAEFIDDDIEKIVLFHLFSRHEDYEDGGGNIETHFRPNPYTGRTNCANVTTDERLQRLTVDFGAGCEAPNGILRAGKIIADFTNEEEGLFKNINITLEDFAVENIGVAGDRYLINDIDAISAYKLITDSITAGSLTYRDGTTYTYESRRAINTYTVPNAEDEFIYYINVEKTGTDRNGDSFELQSEEDISYRSTCFEAGIGQMTGGTLQLTGPSVSKQIVFGGNPCSTEVLVSNFGNLQYRVDLSELIINN